VLTVYPAVSWAPRVRAHESTKQSVYPSYVNVRAGFNIADTLRHSKLIKSVVYKVFLASAAGTGRLRYVGALQTVVLLLLIQHQYY